MKHIITIIISTCLLISCNGISQNNKNTVSKAKDNPKVSKMLEAYNKQEHRLAFNGCEMTYNDKLFKQGFTIKELVNVLGNFSSKHKMFYLWKDIGIVISAKENTGIDAKSRNIYI